MRGISPLRAAKIVLVVLAVARPALAATITYNDGLAHTINSSQPNTNVVVSNGSTLNLVSGAAITAPSGNFGTIGVTGSGTGTSIISTGGAVTGGATTFQAPGAQGAAGLSVTGEVALTISGGTFTGGSGDYGGIGLQVAPKLALPTIGTVMVSGGTFIGGNSTDSTTGLPGEGAVFGHSAMVTGGTFIPGTGGTSNTSPIALFAFLSPGDVVAVSGGVYQGSLVLASSVTPNGPTGVLDILGSGLSFTGGHFIAAGIYGGTLAGSLGDGNAINELVLIETTQAPSIVATPTEIQFGAAAVPEPASAVMLGSGLVGALALAWGRRR